MEQSKGKNGQLGLILLLVLMIAFVIYQVVIAPMLKKEKQETSNVQEETEEEKIARISSELYEVFALSLEEESVMTVADREYLNETLSLADMSDEVKLYLGFKNIDSKYIMNDGSWSLKEAVANANGNYYYKGKYVMVSALEESMKELFGDIPINHKTITLNNSRYVYDEAHERYELWDVKKKTESTEQKIAYKEVVNNETDLYIYEYIAYTDYADPENLQTRTVHNTSVEVVITEENVKDYLNYMDKYRYIFTKQKDGSYLFTSIEYVDE